MTKTAYAAWYAAHRDARNLRRREQYKTDPTLRERRKQEVRERHWATRPVRRPKKQPAVIPLHTWKHPVLGMQSGYGIEEIARLVRRTPRTVQGWLAKGVLPPLCRKSREHPLTFVYTEDEFTVLREAVPLLQLPFRTLRDSVFSDTVWHNMAPLRKGHLPS